MCNNKFYYIIDYDVYKKILSHIIDNLKFLSTNRDNYIGGYLDSLNDFGIIDLNMYTYCSFKIREDLRKYEKENKLE